MTNHSLEKELRTLIASCRPNNPQGIDDLASSLSQQTPDQLAELAETYPRILIHLAQIAVHTSPTPLGQIAPTLSQLSPDQLMQLDCTTALHLAIAAQKNIPSGLNAIAQTLKQLTQQQLLNLHPHTLYHIAFAASLDHPYALNSIAIALRHSDNTDLLTTHPNTVLYISIASIKGHPLALNMISPLLSQMSCDQLLKLNDSTLESLAASAAKGHASALNSIAPSLSHLSMHDLLKLGGATLTNVSAAAISGHHHALDVLLPTLAQTTSDKPEPLPTPLLLNMICLAKNNCSYGSYYLPIMLSYINSTILLEMLILNPNLLTSLINMPAPISSDLITVVGKFFVEIPPSLQSRFDPEKSFRKCYYAHTNDYSSLTCQGLFHRRPSITNGIHPSPTPARPPEKLSSIFPTPNP